MRIRRDTSGPGPYLEWRVRLLGAGAILALAGIWSETEWLVNVAIAFLLVGFMLRFIGRDSEDQEDGAARPPDEPE
ncbi:MAG TPA: hypothetical protein VK858_15490 [Longimicrobiales bacterium]|nr:hypothetical protein [Longimicrobiales bacterium]